MYMAACRKSTLGCSETLRRTKSCLAGEAIADSVARNLAIIEGIDRGLADMRAGRVLPHQAAVRRLKKTITRPARKKSRGKSSGGSNRPPSAWPRVQGPD
jgi:predicted transcriptional regulator